MSLMFGHLICLPIEQLINQVLKHDLSAVRQLARWSGHRCVIDIPPLTAVSLTIVEHKIKLSLLPANQADQWPEHDVALVGQISDFVALAGATDKANELINSQVDIQGDTDFAMALTRIIQQLDIDWEALIAPMTGDLMAHQVGLSVRRFSRWGRQTGESYQRAAKSYLEDEAAYITPQPLLNYFNEQIDSLRLDTDRLDARLSQLEQQCSKRRPN